MKKEIIYSTLVVDRITIFAKTVFIPKVGILSFPHIISCNMKISSQNVAYLATVNTTDIQLPINFATSKNRYLVHKLFKTSVIKAFVYYTIAYYTPSLTNHTFKFEDGSFVELAENLPNTLFKTAKR